MQVYCTVANRKDLVKEIAKRLDVEVEYLGIPTFSYRVGPYEILKDGSFEIDEKEADIKFLRELHADGFIDDSWDEGREMFEITLPLEGHTGKTLTNLMNIMASKAELMNKSFRRMNAFRVQYEYFKALNDEGPETIDDFLEFHQSYLSDGVIEGIRFLDKKISFTGFPETEDPETIKAYMDLAELMNKQALNQKRIKPEPAKKGNDKYAFRIWLTRIGMNGDDYKISRKILLENLSGNSAFRTEEQAERFRAQHRKEKAND